MNSMSAKFVTALAVVALAGAGAGAGAFALLESGSKTTVVRQVTVKQSLTTANTSEALSIGSIYQLAHKSVVEITVTSGDAASPFGSGGSQQSQGSGFVYDKRGDVITNQHVVDGATAISVKFWNGKEYPATLVGADPSTDTAVVKVNAPASLLQPLAVADSSEVAVGDTVVAIGSPYGLEQTITSGIVSALHRQMTSPNNFTIDDSIQTDAAINHGNSGGPLLNLQGKVIGVTAQIESDSGGNDGVGFAVPSNTVREIAQRIISTGKAEHAYLGVSIEAASDGVRLSTVQPDTPSARAGLQTGDIVTRIAGTKITSPDALRHAIDAKQPGDKVTVTYLRGGKTRTATVTLGKRPS
jgi:putative serine protease PepD